VIDQEATKHGMNPDTVRKARQFADPVNGYTVKELDALCRSIRKHQSAPAGAIFGRTHVIRILSVPKKQRWEVQKMAIENGWSTSKLEAHIATQFGSRRDGGRNPEVPEDLESVLVQLEGLCEGWRRWVEVAVGNDADGKTVARKRLKWPTELRKTVLAATKAITDLHVKSGRRTPVPLPRSESADAVPGRRGSEVEHFVGGRPVRKADRIGQGCADRMEEFPKTTF
jgi:hypothetical protein